MQLHSCFSARAQQQSQLAQQLQQTSAATPDIPEPAAVEETISGWQVDPNEPRYCICNDVSYGDMVGCDNEDVSCVIPSNKIRVNLRFLTNQFLIVCMTADDLCGR